MKMQGGDMSERDGERSNGSVEHGELVDVGGGDVGGGDGDVSHGAVTEPAKVMRIGSMVKQ